MAKEQIITSILLAPSASQPHTGIHSAWPQLQATSSAAALPHPQHCREERMSDNIFLLSKGIPYLPQERFLNSALHQACVIRILILV